MQKFRIWFAILGVIGQALAAIEDGKLTPAEMVSIVNSVMTAFGVNIDFSGMKIGFDVDGNLSITIPQDLLDQMTIEFTV